MKLILCECGCGQEVRKPKNRFIFGHTFRGRHHTEDAKGKNREAHLGRKASEKTRALLSQALKGKPNSGQFKKGNIPWMKGKRLTPWNKGKTGVCSQETLGKMRLAHLGVSPANKGIPMTEEQKAKFSAWKREWDKTHPGPMLGKYHSLETLQKMSQNHKGQLAWNKGIFGEKSHTWKGGKSFEPYTAEFNKQLKELIRIRDNYTCQICGVPQNECICPLAIHHIDYNKANCLPSNLISLCLVCNSKVNFNRDEWQKQLLNKVMEVVS